MKVNQIVGEHKKGFRAKTYAQKPKKYIEPVKPQKPVAATESTGAPSKGPASISQAPDGTYTVTYNRPPLAASGTPAENDIPAPQTGIKDIATAQRILASIQREEDVGNSLSSSIQVEPTANEEAKITKSDASGVEITAADGIKTTLPPEKAAALTPDPSNPNEYDLNAAATSPTGETPPGPKVGANVEIKTAEAMTNDLSTMSTTEFVKGIYTAAAENGMAAPEVEAVKKQMVLAPNGEVDTIATMQKAVQVFQSPEWKQMIADLEALVKRAEAQPNAELARIQELAGVPADDPSSSKVDIPPEVLKMIGPGKGFPNLKPIKAPPMPTGQLQSDQKLETNPDGTISYAGGFGTYTYDKAGKPLKYTSPGFAGVTQTTDLVSGNIAVRYNVGPMDMTFNFDKAGKSLDSEKIQYDLGMGVLGIAKDGKGITTRTWQDRGNNVIQSRDMVKDPAAYDRAMAQVNKTQAGGFDPNIDDGGTAYRPGEKEWAEKAAAKGNIDNLAKFNAAADAALGKKPATAESKFKEELDAMLRIAKLR